MCSFERSVHHEEPIGPCRALVHDEHGVAIHTHSTDRDLIHPDMTCITVGLVMSWWDPWRISIEMTPQPRFRSFLETPPAPETKIKDNFSMGTIRFSSGSLKLALQAGPDGFRVGFLNRTSFRLTLVGAPVSRSERVASTRSPVIRLANCVTTIRA